MSVKLTISILLSDRYNTIQKCLESIVPLLQQVSSELILTITGKDPKVRALAEQYTEHIIDYTWIGDFADARNKGLQEANGEWFLFLDDDEWFEDIMPLVEFFTSGEEKEYNGATYRIRNYVDLEGRNYHESYYTRLIRMRTDLEFVGRVHEHPNVIYKPLKDINTFVHHYGYVKKKREVGSRKVSRNLPLELDMIKENPNQQKVIVQIIQEYANIEDLERTEQYCKMGLSLAKEYRSIQNDSWIYGILAKIYYKKHGINEAIKIARKGIEIGDLNEVGKMQLYGILVTFYMRAKEYKNVIDSLEEYLIYYEKFDNNPTLRHEQTRGLMVVDEIMRMKEMICYQGIQAALFLEQAEKIVMYLKEFPWSTPKMLYDYYNSFCSLMDNISKEKKELFQECFLMIHSEDEFILLQKMLYANRKEKKEEVIAYYHKLKNSKDVRVRLYIIWLAGTYQYEIREIVQAMSMEEWQLLLIELLKLIEVEEYDGYCIVMKRLLGEESPYYRQLQFRFLEQDMLERQMSGEELKQQLDHYTKQVCDYYSGIYKEEMRKEEYRYLLHVEYAFSLYYQEAWKEEFDQIASLKKAKDSYPRMIVVIKRLMEYLLREYDRVHSSITPEFQQLGKQVKEQVKQIIQREQYEMALPIVSQLVQLMPNDLEVLRLKQKVLLHL